MVPLNVVENDKSLEVRINAFKATESVVTIKSGEKIQTQKLKTTPNSTYVLYFPKPNGNFSIEIPALELHYNLQHSPE